MGLHVIATAGHVDHGKSSLIVRLTGIDPDRWEEEKRRGLTIDLGFAWMTLPSGHEVGFVDVPGHERFIRNMLAGLGPVRLVLFVVASDEGWKPQSEEHLEIIDVLGAEGAVVALTKTDLVDEPLLEERRGQVRERLAGTSLSEAPIVGCSVRTGEGMDALAAELDRMIVSAPAPDEKGRPRLHIDRSFSIKGAGTVVTGTLTGGTLVPGDEVAVLPAAFTARVRTLQTHQRTVEEARPVSRLAVNLAGVERRSVTRGDVLVRPGQWRASRTIDVLLRPVRSITHKLSARGAYKVYVGSSERDTRLRFHGTRSLVPDAEAFARLTLSEPVVVEAGDRFVLREAGRRETVGGGVILDPHPPAKAGADAESRLRKRMDGLGGDQPSLVLAERGWIKAGELDLLTGAHPTSIAEADLLDGWWISDAARSKVEDTATSVLDELHRASPMLPGMEMEELKEAVAASAQVPADVVAAVLVSLERDGSVERQGTMVRRAGHHVSLGEREGEADEIVGLVSEGEPTPPTQRDLEEKGFATELIEACIATGRLARVSPEVLVTPEFLERAERVARAEAAAPDGLTVSSFRAQLGTTRKYALPILASFDQRRITRRDGDVRRLRD